MKTDTMQWLTWAFLIAVAAETLTRLYTEEPPLAHIGIDFAPTLTRLLTALCDGMTTAHK